MSTFKLNVANMSVMLVGSIVIVWNILLITGSAWITGLVMFALFYINVVSLVGLHRSYRHYQGVEIVRRWKEAKGESQGGSI